ncbi:hypothetical protein [Rubellicoccus peritrichatus]|uniref:Uncharacterized protein n=1 Tax=Rubellicoccus peritrichatus TaxID=3080537 RepID=A0AAQ3LD74_9BACT|nr:hypothetical protein [Puniceicoccus sp. CR14]WOO43565.1 hypothetical protein RZN69_10745 [Puniceicoccus sp. CR14]
MNRQKSGFALIVALALMGFIFLLLMSLSAFVNIEKASVSTDRKLMEARQNALLGLEVALGKLQMAAGPDQRATATADVVYDFDLSNHDAVNNKWLGVWSSKSDINDPLDVTVGLDQREPIWLVSGEGDKPDAPASGGSYSALLSSGDAVEIVSGNRGSSLKRDSIIVRKDAIADEGNFAYWISDEGVKAKITVTDELVGSLDEELISARVSTAQSVMPSLVEDQNKEKPYASNAWNSSLAKESLSKAQSMDSLAMAMAEMDSNLGDTDDSLYENFHDFTAVGKSLLTDMKGGGFRKDLTIAFGDDATFNTFKIAQQNDGNAQLFLPKDSSDVYDPGGPLWEQLYNYSTQYPNDSNEMQFRTPTNEDPGFFPVISRFQWAISVLAIPLDTGGVEFMLPPTPGSPDPTQHNIYGFYFPTLTLWNPYNVDMKISQNLYFETSFLGITIRRDTAKSSWSDDRLFGQNSGTLFLSVAGESVVVNEFADLEGRPNSVKVMRFTIPPLTIPAGESVVLGSIRNTLAKANENNYLVPIDYSPDAVRGFYSRATVNLSGGNANERFGQGLNTLKNYLFVPTGNHSSGAEYANGMANLYSSSDFERQSRILSNDMGSYYAAGDEPKSFRKQQGIKVVTRSQLPELFPNTEIDDPIPSVETNDFEYSEAYHFYDFPGRSSSNNQNNVAGNYDLEGMIMPRLGQTATLVFPGAPVSGGGQDRIPIYSQANIRAVNSVRPPTENGSAEFAGGIFGGTANLSLKNPLYVEHRNPNNEDQYFSKGFLDQSSRGSTGYDYRSADDGEEGSLISVLFDVPRDGAPILSIGDLSHGSFFKLPDDEEGLMWDGLWGSRGVTQNLAPTYAIGNSYADFLIPLDATKINFSDDDWNNLNSSDGDLAGAHYDYSYLLNDALWDGFYFSGLPDGWDPLGNRKIPNSRLKAFEPSEYSAAVANDFDDALSQLYVDGGFNVNSTSVEAWTALLSSFRGLDIPDVEPDASDELHTYARSLNPSPGVSENRAIDSDSDSGLDENEIYAAYRRLTDEEIVNLAEGIVDGIRERRKYARESGKAYPFLTLAEFVNRSIDSSDKGDPDRVNFTYSGVIQASIDDSDINDVIEVENFDLDGRLGRAYFPENLEMLEKQNIQSGAPGYLMQADVLSRIGSVLTTRSDTFKIRAYGDVKDFTGQRVVARAYCEATVQRMPDWVNNENGSSPAINAYDQPVSGSVQELLGRQFVIVDFTWLDESEI